MFGEYFINTLKQFISMKICSRQLATTMKGRDLHYWTSNGSNYGFYVATIDDLVVGTISFKADEESLEFFRLSTDKEFRNLGIATALLKKIEEVAGELGCSKVKLDTSNAQIPAMKLYQRLGYKTVGQSHYILGSDFLIVVFYEKCIK